HVFDDTDGHKTDGASYLLNDSLPKIGVPTVDPSKGEFLYLWVEFENEPNGRKIQAINMVANDAAFKREEKEADRGMYLGDDSNGESGQKLRWTTSSKTKDAMTLVGVDTPGIVNRNRPNNEAFLYNGIKNGRHYALLGAIKPLPDDPTYAIRLG